jgi:Transcriptional Coactivator p15 (PC4)
MLIGKIDIRAREKILVTIREIKKTRMIDVRVHHTSEDGEMVATPAGISLSENQLDQAVELLKVAKIRFAEKE